MNSLRLSGYSITGALGAVLFAQSGFAADLYVPQPIAEVPMEMTLPAVSGLNGKLELSAGIFDPSSSSPSADFRGGASLSVPVGGRSASRAT